MTTVRSEPTVTTSISNEPAAPAEDESTVEAAVGQATTIWQRISARPWVAHLLVAGSRFLERLGTQFAAALTYLSFLAVVPLLMVVFSVAGFILNGRPDLLAELQHQVATQLPGDLSGLLSGVIAGAIKARVSVGIIGLVVALYSGISWMDNVRQAVRAQWRPTFEAPKAFEESFVKLLVRNLFTLAGLGLALLVSVGLTTIGVGAQSIVLRWLGLDNVTWLGPVFTIVPLLLAVGADLLIFMWLFTMLPEQQYRAERKYVVRGALIAAVGFEVLKFAITLLLPKVTGSASGAIFGPIIGLLFFFNLVATVVLFAAAWIATSAGGPKLAEPEELPEIPAPPLIIHDDTGAAKRAGLIGAGAAAGWALGRRRRR